MKNQKHMDKMIRRKRLAYDYDSTLDGNKNNGEDEMALNFLMNPDYSGYKLRSNSRDLYEHQNEMSERTPYALARSTTYGSPENNVDGEFAVRHFDRGFPLRHRQFTSEYLAKRRIEPLTDDFSFNHNPISVTRDAVSSEEARLAEQIQGGTESNNLVDKLQSLTPDLSFYQNNGGTKRDAVFNDLLQQQNRDIDAIAKLMPAGSSMSYDRNQGLQRMIGEESRAEPESVPPYSDLPVTRSFYPHEPEPSGPSEAPAMPSQYNSRQLERVIDQQNHAINDLYKMLEQQQQQQQQDQLQQRQQQQQHVQDTQSSFYGLPEDEIVDGPNAGVNPITDQPGNDLENRSPERFDNVPTHLVNVMRNRLENEEQQNGYNRDFDRSGFNDRRADEENEYARNHNSPDPQEFWNRELLSKLVSMFTQRSLNSAPPLQNMPQQPYVGLMQPVQNNQLPPVSGGEGRSVLPQQPGMYVQSNPATQSSSVNDILDSFLKAQHQNQNQQSQWNFLQSNFPQPAMITPQSGLQNAPGVAMLMVQSLPDNHDDESADKITEKKERVEYKGNASSSPPERFPQEISHVVEKLLKMTDVYNSFYLRRGE